MNYKKLSILLLLGTLMFGVTDQVQSQGSFGTFGVQSDVSPFPFVPAACSAQGYSEDSTIVLPTGHDGQNNAEIHYSESNDLVYSWTSGDNTDVRMTTHSAFDMSLQGSLDIVGASLNAAGGNIRAGINNLGQMVMFYNAPTGVCSCGAFDCVGVKVFVGATETIDIINTTTCTENIDSVFFDTLTNTFFMKHARGSGGLDRRISTFDNLGSTTSFELVTGLANVAGIQPDIIVDATNIYGINGPATIFRVPKVGGAITTLVLSTGIRDLTNIVDLVTQVAGLTDDDSTPAQMHVIEKSDFSTVTIVSFNGAAPADLEAAGGRGAFFDDINGVIHSMRDTDVSAGNTFVRRVDNATLTLLDALLKSACSGCAPFPITQFRADFGRNRASIYFINNDAPSDVYRIKVCSVGGPP